MSELTFNDVVRKEYDESTGKYRVFFPTLCVCPGCNKLYAIFHKGKVYINPKLALQIALVQFGYSTIRNYDNSPPSHSCNCKQELCRLKEEVNKLTINDDSGWSLNLSVSIPERGLREYNRFIKFDKELTTEELKMFCKFLKMDNSPGWTSVDVEYLTNNCYKFSTIYDSSD